MYGCQLVSSIQHLAMAKVLRGSTTQWHSMDISALHQCSARMQQWTSGKTGFFPFALSLGAG